VVASAVGPAAMTRESPPLASLVTRADAGDGPARDALFAALYAELHRLAESHLRRSGGDMTLGATPLLHEAYVDIADREALAFPDRNRFLGYASRAMRSIVIDYVRQRRASKRGGDLTFTSLDEERDGRSSPDATALEAVGAALDHLADLEPGLAQLVDLKFFCGFTFGEIAGMRGVTERTVQREWAKARVVLHHLLGRDGIG
jgi:RNA polymerase sigma factor (TIGR02999 family)